jgi:YVTN family beta-propeller protein
MHDGNGNAREAGRSRSGILISGALALSFLSAAARAQDCSIQSARMATVGAPAGFSLDCDLPAGTKVSWEFGDGATLDGAGKAAAHAYSAIGSYTVFARIEGEDFPATTLITVLNALSPVAPTRSGTLLLDRKRGRLWNVNVDNNSVSVISVASLTRLKEIPVGRAPRTLAMDSLGRIWVANQNDATLTLLDGDRLEAIRTVALPHASRPYGICFDPGGRNVYVTLEATGAVLKLDPETGRVRDSIAVFKTPRGIAVAPDGKSVWVTRFISPQDRGEVAQLTAEPFAVKRIVPLAYDGTQDTESSGSGVPNAISSLTISPDGLRVWVPFKKDNTHRGTRASGGLGPQNLQAPTFESTVRTVVAQINLATGEEVPGARFDLDNRSMACAVAFAQSGAFAFVATETSSEIAVLDATQIVRETAIEPREPGHELGPDGVEISAGDSLVFIHDFLSREVAVYDIKEVGGSNLMPRKALIPTVEREKLEPAVLRGKQIFYNAADPRMSRDKYLSCAVCHLDGGTDGRVWDFTHKGEGMRRTTSLLGKAGLGQGPLHWSANFDEVQDFEHDMRDAFGGAGYMDDAVFNQGTRNRPLGDKKAGLSPGLDDLAAYVSSLSKARPSPYRRADGSLTDDAVEGEKIFNRSDVGCAVCHVPPLYTDSRLAPGPSAKSGPAGFVTSAGFASFVTAEGFVLHDVGTLKPESGKRLNDTLRGLDTPTLKGLWEVDGYLHDGSAATLMDVIAKANPNDRHGKTSQLSETERKQLVAFLMQLDDADDAAGIRAPSGRRAPKPGLAVAVSGISGGLRIAIDGIAAGSPPEVEILGLNGNLVRAFPPQGRGTANAVTWTIPWDGRDRRGRPCPPGMVLIRARQGNNQAVTTATWIP